jgi:CDP-glycerol glycerophosphotransferase
VLYAPTWRDDQNLPGGGFGQDPGIDAPLLQRLLPEATRLLTRMHRNVSRRPEYDAPGFAVDVSGQDQIAELYLAADVLVSDYSSAVYDFAVTGKPIVLLAPDLDHYERSVRGFYFDYASWAPGPVVETTRELAAVLSDLPGSVARYPDFVARFCPLDDGHASARVWDALQD